MSRRLERLAREHLDAKQAARELKDYQARTKQIQEEAKSNTYKYYHPGKGR